VLPIVIDDDGIHGYGHTRRCASPTQRLALTARDGGCSFPGCDVPAKWTQAHHIIEWWNHGPTDLDNLTLLCGHHHREHTKRGWTVSMINGHPWWTPPTWLDPHQQPRRNTLHHPERLNT
jgi:hypothetical protein